MSKLTFHPKLTLLYMEQVAGPGHNWKFRAEKLAHSNKNNMNHIVVIHTK
jgi:hypothetical protein